MLRITITGYLDGANVINRKLDALEERLADATPAWPAVLEVFRQLARATFASEGQSNAGGAWAPLKPATQRQRVKQGYPPAHPILRRTGTLERSVTQQTGDSIIVQTPNYFAVGSAVPWIVYHQSTAPRRVLPRRAVVDFTTDDRHELVRPLRQYFTGLDPVGRKQSHI